MAHFGTRTQIETARRRECGEFFVAAGAKEFVRERKFTLFSRLAAREGVVGFTGENRYVEVLFRNSVADNFCWSADRADFAARRCAGFNVEADANALDDADGDGRAAGDEYVFNCAEGL